MTITEREDYHMSSSTLLPGMRIAGPSHRGMAGAALALALFLCFGLIASGPIVGAQDPAIPHGVCPPFHLRDEQGAIINPVAGENTDRPYSPRQTCGACHDYDLITQGFHFTMGAGEAPTETMRNRYQWASTPGFYGGTWCSPAPLYSYLSPKENDTAVTMDMTSFDILTRPCGACHPGGGSAEYDREGKRYDLWMADPASGFVPGGDNDLDGDYYKARWSESGVLEADCLLCHLPAYDFSARNRQIQAMNFRWAPTAGSGLAQVSGSVAEGDAVSLTYDASRFSADGKLSPHIVRSPRNETCLACHAQPGWKKRGANFRDRTDVHLRAGLRCVDCHPAGQSADDPRIRGKERHDFGRGDDPGSRIRPDLNNTMRDCADCHNVGLMGAPVAKHDWLPPLHLDAIACQTCHIPERLVKPIQVQASDVFNPGTKIPTKGKHLWTFYGPEMDYRNHYGYMGMMGHDDKPTESFRPSLVRYGGKIYPVNRVHSAWPGIETEGEPGLHQPRMNHIYDMWTAHQADPNQYPELAQITDDTGDGVIEVNRPEEIDALIAAVTRMLHEQEYPMEGRRVVWVMNDRVYASGSEYRRIPKEDWEASPYGNVHKYNHDVFPSRAALGANGCVECHSPSSPFFFAQALQYPFDVNGEPVWQPQYALLGFSGMEVWMGVWREAYLKPLIIALMVLLAICLAVGLSMLALDRVSPERPLAGWMRWAPVAVGVYGALVALALLARGDLAAFMLPMRFWFDSRHFLVALFILALGVTVIMRRARRLGALARDHHLALRDPVARIVLGAFLVVVVSGSFMLFQPPLLGALTRLSYTLFDVALLAVLVGAIATEIIEIVTLWRGRRRLVA